MLGELVANSTDDGLFMSSYVPPIVPNYAADAKTLIAHRTLSSPLAKTVKTTKKPSNFQLTIKNLEIF